MGRLQDKICLITGAGSGIGQAIALGFHAEGAIVLINDINLDAAQKTLSKLGSNAEILVADIAQKSDIDAIFEQIAKKYGRLDVLVNNAGITGWGTPFETPESVIDAVMDLNIKGTFFASVAAAKLMKNGGSIVNVSSIVSELGVKNLPIYAASKGAIQSMAKQLAVEWAPLGIRVNTFGPGPINVERNLIQDPNYAQNWGPMIPLGRTGLPEEMVGPAIFLASDDSAFVTGQLFFVDGGWTVQGLIPAESLDSQLKNS